MTIDKQDPVQRMGDEVTGLWRQVGELVRGQSRIEGRLDRVETDVAVLKTDVAVLKTDVGIMKGDVAVLKADVAVLKGDVGELKTGLAGTNQRLDRLELSTERRFNRLDAQLERLIALVMRAETKGC